LCINRATKTAKTTLPASFGGTKANVIGHDGSDQPFELYMEPKSIAAPIGLHHTPKAGVWRGDYIPFTPRTSFQFKHDPPQPCGAFRLWSGFIACLEYRHAGPASHG